MGCAREEATRAAAPAEVENPAEVQSTPDQGPAPQEPYMVALELLVADKVPEVEAMFADLEARDVRDSNGAPESGRLFNTVALELFPVDEDHEPGARLVHHLLETFPKSALPVLLESYRMSAAAVAFKHDRSRFRAANCAVWDLLMKGRAQASHFPIWYARTIMAGRDCGKSAALVRPVFDEGSHRFPAHGIEVQYLSLLAPRHGGDMEAARAFIEEQVAAANANDRDMAYAKLLNALLFSELGPRDFIAKAKVDWPRLRRGLTQLEARYPASRIFIAFHAHFACLADDAAEYRQARARLSTEDMDGFPAAAIPKDCDQRLLASASK
jgi:hypothetical protein